MRFEEPIHNERLRHARLAKGWTQSELAEMLDTDFETVSRWERGISMPSAYSREKLCATLGKTTKELGLIHDLKEPLILSTSPYVFLASSYADGESKFVMHLKMSCQARGLTILSGRTIRRQGGEHQSKALQEAIRAAQAVLLIVSLEARSSRHVQETLRIARIYRSRVCAVLIEGKDWQECLPKESSEFIAMIDAREKNQEQVFDEIIAALEKDQLTTSAMQETAKLLTEPRNPYKGLNAFQSEDQRDFFGRDAVIGELGAALQAMLKAESQGTDSARLLPIVGPSGSGKSSIVLAGLLPRLREGLLPGSGEWVYLDPVLPGAHPIESLALAFAKQMPYRSLKTIRDDLEDDTALGLHLLASHLRRRPDLRVVLFVDQFEEVFTQTITEEERQHFLDLLVTAVSERQGATIVILTLRADFYDRPMHYPEFCELLEASQRLLLPMDLKCLREAVEKPAGLPDVQLTFEGDLVGDLVFEVQGQVGALPLLQFTLDQLFQRRSSHRLTLEAYREIGGARGALARHAESTYASLPTEEHRRMARVLFLRLIDPGATEQEATRRRALRSELQLSHTKEAALIEEVISAFTAARLLTTNTIAGVPTVEVSHEALIREWARLAAWLHEGREDVRLQQAISEDVAEWEQRDKSRDRLYRGSQLKEAQAWVKRNAPSKQEAAFLRASIVRRLQTVVGLLTLLLLLISSAGIAGWLILNQPPDPRLVTNLKDDGVGSLRWCINNAPTGSTITFTPGLAGQTITLTGTLSIPNKQLYLQGPAGVRLTISNAMHGIVVGDRASITITNLIFTGSQSNSGSLFNNQGNLTLKNSTVSDNTLSVFGSGGGIYNTGTLTLLNSTVSGNMALWGDGGGIFNAASDPPAQVILTNSTVSGNTALRGGGGIENSNGILKLNNSTVSGNTALEGDGGGIKSLGNHAELTFCTIYGNRATTGGGIAIIMGVDNAGQTVPGSIKITNSIVAGNSPSTSPDISGRFVTGGYNLIEDLSGTTVDDSSSTDLLGIAHDKVLIDPALRDNGGPTQTLRLLRGSPASDKIPVSACLIDGKPTTDQRGAQRPDGHEPECDIGAFESPN